MGYNCPDPAEAPPTYFKCRGCNITYEHDGTEIIGMQHRWCSTLCYMTEDCECGCSHGEHGDIHSDDECTECDCRRYVAGGVACGIDLDPNLLRGLRLESAPVTIDLDPIKL